MFDRKRIIQEEVAGWQQRFEAARRTFWDEILPELVERESPANRMALYGLIDFNDLQQKDAYLWAKLTADQNQIANRNREQEMAARQEYENQQYTSSHIFRSETQPFGARPFSNDVLNLGLNSPLPLS